MLRILVTFILLLSVAAQKACRPAAAADVADAAAIAVAIALSLTVAYNVGGLMGGWGDGSWWAVAALVGCQCASVHVGHLHTHTLLTLTLTLNRTRRVCSMLTLE